MATCSGWQTLSHHHATRLIPDDTHHALTRTHTNTYISTHARTHTHSRIRCKHRIGLTYRGTYWHYVTDMHNRSGGSGGKHTHINPIRAGGYIKHVCSCIQRNVTEKVYSNTLHSSSIQLHLCFTVRDYFYCMSLNTSTALDFRKKWCSLYVVS